MIRCVWEYLRPFVWLVNWVIRLISLGVRIDSGDMAYLSKKVRKLLDEAGYPHAKIYASNDLDENTILNLKMQKAKIDIWGVGTKLITAYDQPALGLFIRLFPLKMTMV